MSSVSKTNTFTPNTYAEAADVNQNFDDVVNYINDEVIVRDASKAFTAIPSGPSTDPSADNQFTRKKYVDDKVTTLTSTVTTNKTAQDNGFLTRPTASGQNNQIIKTAQSVITTDSLGEATITFSPAFPTACLTVVACIGDYGAGSNFVSITSTSNASFKVAVFTSSVVDPFGTGPSVSRLPNGGARINWIAIGY